MPLTSDQNSRFWPLLLLIGLAAVMGFGNWMQGPPTARSDAAPATEFSAQRAQAHVDVIASRPHPAGSPANAEVRDYLIETLRDLGAEVEVQRRLQTYNYLSRAGQSRFANVENIVARFPGQQTGPALLLMAHYDSAPNAPGAGDDASGVAAELETVRALAVSDLPMRNTLIVLFTDAEEVGLIGAQAFFGHHRWAEQVGLVLNFDSRGNRGPVFMYGTSENNGALIDALAQIAPSPLANSLVHSIMQKMPQFDDLAIAVRAGKAGMNFAFIDGYYDYHGSTDTSRRLSPDSLQHLGDFALPLARHFGTVELPIAELPDRHYFNPVGHILASYPAWVDGLVWLLAAILLIITSVRLMRRGSCSLLQLLRGISCAFLLVAAPALFVLLLDRLIDQTVSLPELVARQRGWFAAWALLAIGSAMWLQGALRTGLSWSSGLIVTTLLAGLVLVGGADWPLLAAAIVTGVSLTLLLRRPLVLEARIAGGLWLLVLLALAALLQLAGGAHVLVWPLLAVALLQFWFSRHPVGRSVPQLFSALAGLPAAVLLGATALTFDLIIGFVLPVVSVLPLLLLLLFYTPLMDNNSARATGFGAILIGVAVLGWLTLTLPWSAEKPQPVALFILYDADQHNAYWASSDDKLTNWHRTALGSDPQLTCSALYQPDACEQLWLSPIKGVNVSAPQLELIEADREQRRVLLRIRPDRAGDTVTLWLKPGAGLQGWQVEGQLLPFEQDDSIGWRSLTGFALPASGVVITLELEPGDDWPELLVTGVHNGLPDGLTLPPRRGDHMHSRSYSDATVAARHVAIDDLLADSHR
ncbi:MAG: M20/M25/M40 family metallo-hydrolase [Alphaproteobacteria bacterium]|nr:M20/M25/M40 family metallo-hydrolase [Alphaproteobacteria bacterium]